MNPFEATRKAQLKKDEEARQKKRQQVVKAKRQDKKGKKLRNENFKKDQDSLTHSFQLALDKL